MTRVFGLNNGLDIVKILYFFVNVAKLQDFLFNVTSAAQHNISISHSTLENLLNKLILQLLQN